MFDSLSLDNLLQKVKDMQMVPTSDPTQSGSWGTTVTPDGGTTQPVNGAGISDAFMSNLKNQGAGQSMAKALTSGMNPPTPQAPHMSASQNPSVQADMGRQGMEGLKAMSRPVGSPGPFSMDPSAGGGPAAAAAGAPPQNPMMPQQSPFLMRRPIY